MERSQIWLLIVCFMLSSLIPSNSAQMDPDRRSPRCIPSNNTTDLPRMCTQYYDVDDFYFRGSQLSGIQNAFQRIGAEFRESDNEICVDLIMQYLCYYYFPLCNPDTGEIVTVCSSSCTLLTNNPDCMELRGIANDELMREQLVSTGDSCMPTHRSYVNPPPVSNDCVSIEEAVNETFPLTCLPIPSDNTCRPQLPYSYFAPATFEGTSVLFGEIQTILDQLGALSACTAFINIVICVFRFPACNPMTGRILPICRDSCESVDSIILQCSSEFFRNDSSFPATNALLNSFMCLQPQTYYNFPPQYIETENASDCSGIVPNNATIPTMPPMPPMPRDESDDSSDDSDNNGVIIIASVVTGVLVIVIVIILVIAVLYVKRKNKKLRRYTARHDSSNEYSEQPSTVRYHAHDDHLGLNLNYASNAPSPYLTPRGIKTKGDASLTTSKSSLILEVNHFLDYVQDKFSEVLLPVDTITKEGLLGKGAFGVVHKGEMKSSDGSIKAVAIKTIKCKVPV